MAIEPEIEDDGQPPMNPAAPQDSRLVPALQDALNSFQTPQGAAMARTVLPIIQQHVNAVNVADANRQVGERVVHNIAQTKDNLVGLVKDDPTAAEMAIRLAPHLVAGVVSHSGLDPDQMAATHADLTGHIQTEIARAAVTRMAQVHEDPARTLLSDLSAHLSDDDQSALGNYITTMQHARSADAAAETQQLADNASRQSRNTAFAYGQRMLDPRTETTVMPPDFMSGLMTNGAIQPSDRAPLAQAFSRLHAYGDPATSDPHIVANLLQGISDPDTNVPPAAIMQHVGGGLRYADAQMLHGLSLARAPGAKGTAAQLSAIVADAARRFNPAASGAGNAAFGRFVNWLMPAFRRGGPGSLDPQNPSYLMKTVGLDQFAPRHDDIMPPVPSAHRPSLASIFGGRNG